MKRIAAIVAIVFIIILILSLPTSAQYEDCINPLIAGKENLNSGIDAGMVTVTSSVDDPNILFVDFETYDGWEMTETHLYVGSTPPTKSAPGQFIYKHDPVEDPFFQDEYEVSLVNHMINVGDDIYFAAHAALQKMGLDGEVLEETAWAFGTPIRDTGTRAKNWAMYFICTTGDGEDDGNQE